MTLQHLKEEGDKEFDKKFVENGGVMPRHRDYGQALCRELIPYIHSERIKAWNTAFDIALSEIKNSSKTFGLLDKEGKGGAILISDIEEIISKLKQ